MHHVANFQVECFVRSVKIIIRGAFVVTLCLLAISLLSSAAGADSAGATPYVQSYTSYAVASDHQLASAAGAEVLKAGGNAADAASAVLLALGVVSPASSGFGGGGFALYYRASDQKLSFVDFREQAPAAAAPDMFANNDKGEGPASRPSQLGGLASGVPGEPAGIDYLYRTLGSKKVTLAQIAAPAVGYAKKGVKMETYVANMTQAFGKQIRKDRVMRHWFARGADTISVGRRVVQKELGRTLETFGKHGARAIYEGTIASKIVKTNRAAGGVFSKADLAAYRVRIRKPLSRSLLGYRFVTAPPPSAGGYTLLSSLATLAAIPEAYRQVDNTVMYHHALIESWKGPFLDRQRYFGDPDFVKVPLASLNDKRRAETRARVFHPLMAMPPTHFDLPIEKENKRINPAEDHGTSHFCVVDGQGNIASVTSTVNLPFGARYTAAGMVMNDQMDDFASAVGKENAFGLLGGARNLPQAGKRPVSTMSPTIVFEATRPVFCAGAAGGSKIVTATEQVILNALLRSMPMKEAIAALRIHHQANPNAAFIGSYSGADTKTLQDGLRLRGHVVKEVDHNAIVQAIDLRRKGKIVAASDPRKGGRPAGH